MQRDARAGGLNRDHMGVPAPPGAPDMQSTRVGVMREKADRRRLRTLDACLGLLEEAHVRGEQRVSAQLAARIRPHAPAVRADLLIADAIDAVLRDQEPHMVDSGAREAVDDAVAQRSALGGGPTDLTPGIVVGVALSSAPPLEESNARQLTERIKASKNHYCSLLLEAHERRAWVALGYSSWESYVRAEFQLSRSRSYEILDHSRVLRALEAATGVSGIPDITPFAAAQIKRHLPEVTEAIRSRMSGAPTSMVSKVAKEVVDEIRARVAVREGVGESLSVLKLRPSEAPIYEALNALIQMRSDSAALLDSRQWSQIEPLLALALQRLGELVDACRRAHPATGCCSTVSSELDVLCS